MNISFKISKNFHVNLHESIVKFNIAPTGNSGILEISDFFPVALLSYGMQGLLDGKDSAEKAVQISRIEKGDAKNRVFFRIDGKP
jgi:hypothetical protein